MGIKGILEPFLLALLWYFTFDYRRAKLANYSSILVVVVAVGLG